ncbi:MAG: biotin--[acetyl-CoA-carboxylase] ligase [Candidatus Cloacimonetes bacterium]|nr:biotin--[acetyl-CoA-carboxylase] ligase [Candidatus Cloacimonadota bacterium]
MTIKNKDYSGNIFKQIPHIESYKTIDSTKDLAEKYIISQKYEEHFLIIAENQTQGKGRKGNDWLSPQGGLWFSLVLNHISQKKAFTLFIGFCVLNALNELCTDQFKIKWPNDIYLQDKKVCGIICSQHSQYNKTNIGIGINTNIKNIPDTFPSYSGSIMNLLDIEIDNKIYLSKILENIFQSLPYFEKQGINQFFDEYKKFDYLIDKKIKIISDSEQHEGVYKGIDKDGSLLLIDFEGNVKTIYSGSVIV